jgi:large subunit ribosomal protein L11
MAKKVVGSLKLEVKAGQANPSPPIGPALGQRGLNIMEFCKTVNAATKDMEPGSPVPVIITYYQDKSFTIEIKTAPASHLLKKAAKVNKGSSEAGRGAPIGKVTQEQIREIAELKLADLNTTSVEAACRSVAGTARSMGLEVVD